MVLYKAFWPTGRCLIPVPGWKAESRSVEGVCLKRTGRVHDSCRPGRPREGKDRVMVPCSQSVSASQSGQVCLQGTSYTSHLHHTPAHSCWWYWCDVILTGEGSSSQWVASCRARCRGRRVLSRTFTTPTRLQVCSMLSLVAGVGSSQ